MKEYFVMDIETFEKDYKVVPFLFTLKTNLKIYNFFIKDHEDLISVFLNQIELDSLNLNFSSIDVYTHNINFDGFILIEYFLKNNIPYKWFMRNLNLYYLDFTYKGFNIKIRCSYKFLGLSVKKLGDLLGEHKQPFPYKFVNLENLDYIGETPNSKFFENEDEWSLFIKKWGKYIILKDVVIEYATQDVLIVYNSLENIFKISDIKIIKNSFSFSSYSYKLFSKKYDFKKISKEILNISDKNYIENSYFGGRTEIFGNTKEGLIHRFDFPGMYGSCMKEKFPYGKPYFDNPKDFDKPGFYSATVLSDLKIPILPIRSKNKKILYPNGRFTTCLSRDEFLLFIEKGGKIEKIHSALLFPKEDYLFKEFVDHFEKIKLKGGFNKLYGKQVINSLYGSFALRKENIKYLILYSEKELKFLENECRLISFSKYDRIIIACVELKEGLNPREQRNLSYASFISSKARIKLHRNVYAVDDYYSKKYKDSYKLLYLETDSIDVSLPENCLGENIMDVSWQKVYKEGVFVSPKFYFIKEDRSKIKGVRKSNYSYEEISKSFYENKEELIFKNQLQFTKKDFSLIQSYLDKKLKISSYDKRIFSEDKLSTKAIEIWE